MHFPLFCISFPLSCWISCRGHRDTVEKAATQIAMKKKREREREKRQQAGCITCCLGSKRYGCAASTQLQCKPLHISKHPAFPICLYAQHTLSWGISSAMNAGLFQTLPNVPLSSGGLRRAWERRCETGSMDGCGDITVTAEGHFIKSYDRECCAAVGSLHLVGHHSSSHVVQEKSWMKENLLHLLVGCDFPAEQLLTAVCDTQRF